MSKLLTVFGMRPKAIKTARVLRGLSRLKEIDAPACVSCRHHEMRDQVLINFEIEPDSDLNRMRGDQTLSDGSKKTDVRRSQLREKHYVQAIPHARLVPGA